MEHIADKQEYFDDFKFNVLADDISYQIEHHDRTYASDEDYLERCRSNILAEVRAVMYGYGKRIPNPDQGDVQIDSDDDDPDDLRNHLIKYKVDGETSYHFYPDAPTIIVRIYPYVETFDQGFVGTYMRQYVNTFGCKLPLFVTRGLVELGTYNEYSSDSITVSELSNSLSNMGFDSQVRTAIDNLSDVSCPICLEAVKIPSITKCKHIFCSECIEVSLRHCNTCPSCRAPLTVSDVTTLVESADDTPTPIPCNEDQERTVTGVKNNIEVIQGPPGTGKSTTIYHLITRRLTGRTLVTSRNNQAIAAVCEKLARHHTTVWEDGTLHIVVLGRMNRISDSSAPYHINNMIAQQLKITPEIIEANEDVEKIDGLIKQQQDEINRENEELTARHIRFVNTLNLEMRDMMRLIVFTNGAPSKSRCMKGRTRYLDRLENYFLDCPDQDVRDTVRMLDTIEVPIASLDIDRVSLERCIKDSKRQVGPAVCLPPHSKLPLLRELNMLLARAKAKKTALILKYREKYESDIKTRSNVFLSTISSAWRAQQITTVIVDEAATVEEESIPGLFKCNPKNVILIGDHKQLKPFSAIDQFEPSSFFERMTKICNVHLLKTQYRMAPSIGTMVSNVFYNGQLKHGTIRDTDTLEWIDCKCQEDKRGKSTYNEGEANVVARAVRTYMRTNPSKSVMVITFYGAQLRLLRDQLGDECRVVTVDSCQGTEADAVFVSCVRSNPHKNIGFCRNRNRLCVAMSRAREQLTIIGNKQTFQKNFLWKSIIDFI